MRTGDQKRYYDILRREAGAQKARLRNGASLDSKQPNCIRTRTAVGSAMRTYTSAPSGLSDCAEPSSTLGSCVCDPLAELGIPLTQVHTVTDFVCSHRGFTSLHPNFFRFEHLRCIAVEHNALETLQNLVPLQPHSSASLAIQKMTADGGLCPSSRSPPLFQGCRRLTHLHAAYNCIRDIAVDTEIPRLTLLEHLSLAYNQLSDLDKVLHALRRLKNLRFLDLRGNPVIGEPRYRKRCVAALPQVEILDCQFITPKEREAVVASARWSQRAYVDRPRTTTTITAAAAAAAPATTLRPGTSPSLMKGIRVNTDPFSKSPAAKDLERKYAAYLRQQKQAQEATEKSAFDTWRQKEETWESFHALWTLSQTGMPLSADAWQRTQAAATASENAQGDTERRESRATTIASPSNPRQPASGSSDLAPAASSLSMGRKQVTVPSLMPASPPTNKGTGSGTTVPDRTLDVSLDRPLFPSTQATAATVASEARSNSPPSPTVTASTSMLPLLHDSVYFRFLRNGAAASHDGTAQPTLQPTAPPPTMSRLLPLEGPAPDRLATVQRTLQASALVVRAAEAWQNSLETQKKAGAAAAAAVQERAGTGRRSAALSSQTENPNAPTCRISLPLSALRTIQETKYAVIPPAWEDTRGCSLAMSAAPGRMIRSSGTARISPNSTETADTDSHRIGVVSAITVQQEALAEILVLLYYVYSVKEIQTLEEEYGTAELLRLLPLRDWVSSDAESAAGSAVNISVAARQAIQLLSRHANAGSSSGNNPRSLTSQDDRKRTGAKSNGHGGNTGAGSAAGRGGGVDLSGGAPTPAIALTAAVAALPHEPEQVWQLLTGPYVVAGATAGGSPGVMVYPSDSSCVTVSNPTPSPGATSNGSGAVGANTSSANSAAAPPAASLHDPEVAQYLVRPIGSYTSFVLGPLLALLRAPGTEEDVQRLCDALVHHHSVNEQATAASAVALIPRTTNAELQHRSASTGLKTKGESLQSSDDTNIPEVRRKKVTKTAMSNALADTVTPSLSSSVPSVTATQKPTSAKPGHSPLYRQQQSVTTQVTLTALLTALLFSPTFVRTRVAYLEEKLQRLALTAAANSIIAAADNPSQRTGANTADHTHTSGKDSNATGTLPQLFHRVQAVKMHLMRMEAVLAAADPSEAKSGIWYLLDPKDVLTAYCGRR